MNSLTAAEQVGISYRQLDFWIRNKYIRAAMPGSGVPRNITGAEFDVLRYMSTLVKAGVSARRAAVMARRLARGKDVALGPWTLSPRDLKEAS
jgi:hypothetical protein